jgi:cytochrome c-type biogenesis protein CcmH
VIRRTAFTVGATAVAAVALALLVISLRPSAPMSPAQQAAQLDAQLRCPDCQGLSVAESQTTAAAAIRTEVARRLADGQSPDDVRAYFVSRYGEWILLEPASVAWWVLPFVVIALGAAGLVAWLWVGRRGPAQPPTDAESASPPAPGTADRVRDEVEALDA